jgi:2-methylcitrate dehydratase PrpD
LEGKFSMPFCAAAAVVHGRVGIDTFDAAGIRNAQVAALMPRIAMRVDPSFDGSGPPLTQAQVTIHLRDGRVLTQQARGARGYPEQPAGEEEIHAKFLACARRALSAANADRALALLQAIEDHDDIRQVTSVLSW